MTRMFPVHISYKPKHKLRLVFDDVVSDVRRWSTFSGEPVSGEAATATTGPATAATRPLAGVISGGPTAAASAWASSRSGAEDSAHRLPWSGDQLPPADLTAAPPDATTIAFY